MNIIYAITNPLGECYIGASSAFLRRRASHRRHLRRGAGINRKLQASWDKHGAANHTFTAVASALSREHMHIVELAVMQSRDCSLNVNMTPSPIKSAIAAPRKPKGVDCKMRKIYVSVGTRKLTLREWSAESGVPSNTIKQRIHSGWTAAQAVGIDMRPLPTHAPILVGGKTLAQLAIETGVSVGTLYSRIKKGLPPEKFLAPVKEVVKPDYTPRVSTITTVTAFGKTLTLKAWSRETDVSLPTMYYRLKNGWPPEAVVRRKIAEAGTAGLESLWDELTHTTQQ